MTSGELTVFEKTMQNYADWTGEGEAPAYPLYEGLEYVALVDRFPKFDGQVVIFPSHGQPGQETAPYNLPPSLRLGMDYLTHVIQTRMSSRYPKGRIIRHEEGFAVPDHPHVVLFPAQRGEGKKLYEPSQFEPDKSYYRETQRLLQLESDQKRIVDEKLKRLIEAVVDWT